MNALVSRLQATLLSEGLAAIPEQPAWTMVDFPRHYNCGDSAIWLGQRRLAQEWGRSVVRVLDRETYRPEKVPADSAVVIQGGGNLGGLYPTHHALRLAILEHHRGVPVIQMPQSVEYRDQTHRDELRRAVSAHGDVVLLVRDDRSYERAAADFDCRIQLVPDAAFALGSLRGRPPVSPVVAQVRSDRESSQEYAQRDDWPTFDWLTPPRTSSSRVSGALAGLAVSADLRRSLWPVSRGVLASSFDALARANLARASRLLSRGEVVVTDRLHGHVLCTLLGRPHVLVDDKHGKVRALWDTWTHDQPAAVFVSSWAEATEAVEQVRARLSQVPA